MASTLAQRGHLILGLLVVSLLLSACGFKLRGVFDIPEALRQVSLVSSERPGDLERTLEQTLRVNGVHLEADAPYRIELLEIDSIRRAISLGSDARVSEYELRSEVTFQVSDREGQLLLPPTRLFTERVYSVDPNNITASESQEPLLRRQITQDLAQQIVRQYTRLRP
ncbi:LPS-assembly lipoprotein LptE [Nitrincola tapanii]|uniref:LPS-assembly lipoprotein LptE n=1 Tax=Nitrincola tapanii TaxID=1708751 RepID=A0A5A9W3D3_9GAMM|nr:LPS assembly lipoprotein LptE [Nitrincola tapanii]KAA0874628.1 hypothetical protein E1H14_07305 [Nitrincola tapanii]